MQQDKLLKLTQVAALLGLSRATLYRLLKENQFPKAVILSAHSKRWRESDIQNYLASLEHVA
jgi:predicted DNA-binding transcriptional regulator AlpA